LIIAKRPRRYNCNFTLLPHFKVKSTTLALGQESGIKAHSFIILALCRIFCRLVVAQEQTTSREILLWMTPSEAPKALQASECSELLDPTRANCWISAQHQPGKFKSLLEILRRPALQTFKLALIVHYPATKAPPRQHSQNHRTSTAPRQSWAEAHIKIARMTLTIKLDRNWSSFQLANSAPPLSVTDSAIAPSARIGHSAVRAG